MARRHSLPHEIIAEVPRGINQSVVSLNVCIEALVVEDAVNCTIESVDTGVVLFKLGPGQALPKVDFAWFASRCRGVAGQDPGMRSLLVGSHADKGIKAEPE